MTTAPVIVTDGVQVTSTPATGDTYRLGETIEITVTFDTAVTVDTSGGTPRIRFVLNGGGNRVVAWAEYSSGSGGTALEFTYTVQADDLDDDGIWLPADFLQLQSGTIRDAADNTVDATLTYVAPGTQNEHKVDGGPTTTAPAIVTDGVQVTSTPMATADTYGLGETIEITVTFDTAVTVDTSGGTPRIQFRLGPPRTDKWAEYSSGSGGTALVFTYTVQSGDMDDDGIWLPADFLQLQSGTIRDAADNTVDATLTYLEPGLQTGHKVNAPTEPGAPTSLTATASGTTTIDLSWTAPGDNGGSAITGYRIEVSPNGSSGWTNRVADTGTTATTYSHTGLSAGTTRHYRVSAINSVGTGDASNVDDATTDDATTTNTAATGMPTISGTAQVGEILMAFTSSISDADGKTKAEDGDTGYAYTYQWILVDGNNETEISGETSSAYTPSSSDVGKTIRVKVSFIDDLDNAEGPFTSDQTAAVTVANLLWSTTMTVGEGSSGGRGYFFDEAVGELVIDSVDSFEIGSTDYQVLALLAGPYAGDSSKGLVFWTNNAILSYAEYTLEFAGETLPLADATPNNTGKILEFSPEWLTANASTLNAANFETTLPVNAMAPVCLRTATEVCPGGGITTTNTPATGQPGISGTPQVGQMLTAGIGTIADVDDLPPTVFPAGYSFQWVRVDSSNNETDVGTDSIGFPDRSTYSPTSLDVGSTIKVKVSFIDNAGNSEGPLTSDAYPASGTIAPATTTPPPDTNVLVSNTGERLLLGGTSSMGAQSLVTGSNAGGYAVSAVQIRLKSVSGKTTVVKIKEDNNGEPGNLVATLTNPASLSANKINTFTAPPGTTFAASTTYWITRGEGMTFAITAATDETGEPGWSIGDSRLYRTSETLPWFTSTQSSLMIAIKGAAIGAASDDATLSALTVNDGTSDLTLDPAFAPGTFAYAADVDNAVTTVTLTAMTTDDGASVNAVTLGGIAIADTDFTDGITVPSLLVDDNDIVVTVTAENNSTTRTYTVTVTRAAATTTDTPGVRVTPTALRVTEEDTTGGSYTVGLNTQPTAVVTVTVAGHAGTAVTPDPATLTFTTSDWETAQRVTVTAGNDTDLVNDTVTLTHSAASTDSDYSGITIAGVTVTVTDNDNTAAVICGRTPAVRDELLRLIENNEGAPVACADVTATHLAAITRTLDLSGQNIADLKAGDFAGLTSLTDLYLFNNALTTLPDDVFDDLTALEILTLGRNDLPTLPAGVFDRLIALTELGLDNNDLPTLPAGVFDRLIALKILTLNGNDLPTLPAGVFGRLIALTELQLQYNPGAPFAPTADARPDAGTVPVAGGAVTLDGSGGGGPWGTNVSYSWELTTPTSGVTFDDNTSAMPVVTIPALPAGTELTFTLTVTGRGGTDGIASDTDTAKVTATGSPASDDATLGALTVDAGTNRLTLDPAFAPGTFAYAAEVGNAVTTVTLTAMTTDDGASVSAVTLNGTAITDRDFTDGITVSSLLAGDNGIVVTVTAENNSTTRTYTVTVTRQAAVDNTAPTASDASVTTNEDTAHTFAAADVNFSDSDGDALASVTVVTLPAEGVLALNGTAVTAGQVVPAADIAQLVFTPAANGNGTGYARFTFRVSDGTDLSASAYTMTVNVTAVNDPATGAPAISGTAQVGETLTAATTDIADADGLASPSYGYQWVRVDGSNETDIAGAASGTYMPEAADVGKKLKVKVSFTDDDSNDEELTSDAYPASGTVEAAPTTAPTVTISADKTSAVFKEDDITFTVTRTGSTTAALPVTVRLTQTEDFLAATELTSKTVTIGAGQSTATFTVAASSFQHFAAGTKVGGGTLTATVQDGSAYDPGTTDSVEVDIAIGVMIGFEMAAYSVGEATGPVKVKVIAHTGPGAGQPTSEATYNVLPADGSATNPSDFFFVNISASFLVINFSESGGVWQAEHGYDVTITNDEDDEDDETFDLRIERVQSTATYSLVDASGNSCGSVCTATVTIIDDDTATPGVTVSTTALTVTEADTTGDSYTVVLDSRPTADVTVTVAGHSGTDVTPDPTTLIFTTMNWDTARAVTVTAGDDADTTDDSVSLTHGATSADTDYGGIGIAGVTVTVSDNDAGEEPLPLVSVADVKVREDSGAMLAFQVTLDRASRETATVDWETLNGSGKAGAKAGQDYVAASGMLAFTPGETVKTVNVAVLDDVHDEGQEVMLLVLSNARGAVIGDAVAKGTIENSDRMPAAWLTRFGRAASDHVVEAVGDRWQGGPRASHLTIGGRRAGNLFGWAGLGGQADGVATADRDEPVGTDPSSIGLFAPSGGAGAELGATAPGMGVSGMNTMPGVPGGVEREAGKTLSGRAAQGTLLRALGLPDPRALPDLRTVLMGSSFFYSAALDEDGRARTPGWLGEWSTWGRTAASRFGGADGGLSLDGEVATAMLGFDSRWDRWLAGVVVSHSEGRGAYRHATASGGAVASSMTGLHPYARFELNERTSVWGVLGYGAGELSLTPERSATALGTDLTNAMAAFGGRTALSVRTGRAGRFELAARSDARLTSTASDAIEGLVGAAGQTGRVRLMLEGSGSMPLAGGVLKPTLEAGLRYDAGDAETGAGLEVGGGLGYAAGRLSVEINARGLLAHQDAGYEEWGFGGSIAYTPSEDGRGLSMRLGSAWGATQSGVQSLWSRQDASGLARHAAFDAAQRYRAELRYGLDGRKGRARWEPYVGVESGDGSSRALRLGVTLTSGLRLDAGLELGLRQGLPGADPEYAAQLRGELRW